jgi:hypothetical protein
MIFVGKISGIHPVAAVSKENLKNYQNVVFYTKIS